MSRPFLIAVLLLAGGLRASAQLPKPIAEGLKSPWAVAVGPDGKIYVSERGTFDKKDGVGRVVVVENGKVTPFVDGLDDPKGIAVFFKWLFIADKNRVLRVDTATKKVELFAPPNAFPVPPVRLGGITVDPESGTLYVSDSGERNGAEGAVYRITPQGLVGVVVDGQKLPGLKLPGGVVLDGASHLLVAAIDTGTLYRVKLATGAGEKVADGLGAPNGLAWDNHGRLYISDIVGSRVLVIPRPGDKPVVAARGFATGLCTTADRKQILFPDMMHQALFAIPATVPGAGVDESPLSVGLSVAFPDLKWTGWKNEDDAGKAAPLRPIALTHAGDGSGRVFVATQHGVIHSFHPDKKDQETTVFADLQDRVKYNDNTNEEGFLGLAFHPKFKETGEFFVFYTPRDRKVLTNVVSRFRVRKDDPSKADPASEEILLTFEKPYWNHDGGTIAFGPDGYLYVTHGDGGAGNDLYDNGQNLGSLLGKILRIDVTAKADGKNYAVPRDNPFVGTKGARPEIFAYGLRNVWRMAFDRTTGQLWAADVGQNLYEEIDLIRKGGNYGWNRREGLHPFGALGVGPRPDLVDPVWEYHHDVGKSITGGTVYRGGRVPELAGYYVYGDYVAGKVWALKYDEAKGRVTENRPVAGPNLPVYSFGEDEKGEVYMLTSTTSGRGIYRFGQINKR